MMTRALEDWEVADAAEEQGDLSKAERLFRRAAKRGNPIAMNRLATILDDRKSPPHPRAAVYWYKKAVEAGDATAAWNLAMHYKNRNEASRFREWLQVAASMGDEDAIESLSAEKTIGLRTGTGTAR